MSYKGKSIMPILNQNNEVKNYIKLFDIQIEDAKMADAAPRLLLHACCAPCSSHVLECLADVFDITLYFYNPNISPREEYEFRASELERLISEMLLANKPRLVIAPYENEEFEKIAFGKENERERGSRCTDCYNLRLVKTAEYAEKNGFDFFSTTLSISPHKDAVRLNDIGERLSAETSVKWLYSFLSIGPSLCVFKAMVSRFLIFILHGHKRISIKQRSHRGLGKSVCGSN